MMHPDHFDFITKLGLILMGLVYGLPFVKFCIRYVGHAMQYGP